jgi:hypothetical protein
MEYTREDQYHISKWIITKDISVSDKINHEVIKSNLHHKLTYHSATFTHQILMKLKYMDPNSNLTEFGYNNSRKFVNDYENEVDVFITQHNLNKSQIELNDAIKNDLKNKLGWIIVTTVVTNLITYVLASIIN